MALVARRLPGNAAGDFYVDSTCIDCDACRQIAPATFRGSDGQSIVGRQPASDGDRHRALMALVACPTASIGTISHLNASEAVAAFPEPIAPDVCFCGFTAESSFGAWSYLIVRPDDRGGNVLVDSPRFTMPLVRRIEAMGGVKTMFLSHRDDIADHQKFAAHFGCPRVMHEGEGTVARGMEYVTSGREPVHLDDDLTVIPTPGHTRGHQVLLYRNETIFTGDHLAWSPTRQTLTAFRGYTWYSWEEQITSMERLLAFSFSAVLPGHGWIHHSNPADMHRHLEACVAWMRTR